MEDLKLQILKAIENGDYEVSIEEPNNITQCTKYDGTVFYIMQGDDVKFGCYAGFCHVHFLDLNYTFTCELDYGEWKSDCNLEDDEDIIEAIESIDGVISGEHYDTDSYMSIYYAANPDAPEGDVYGDWSDDMPTAVNDLGWNDVYLEIEYKTSDSDNAETRKLGCTINDKQLYDLYVHLRENEDFEKGVTLSHTDIKEFDEELFNVIMEQIIEDIENGDNHNISFLINISADTIESKLG